MKKFVLLFITSFPFYFLSPTLSQDLEWVDKEGPYNIRDINDVSVGITSGGSDVEYIATTYDGLLKTTNNGNSWTTLLSYQSMNAVACVQDKPDVIYASRFDLVNDHFYKSTNGGSTFFTIDNDIGNLNIIKIAISPSDPDRILIGCYACLTSCPTLYITTNAGINWQSIDYNGSGYDDQNVVDIAWSLNNSDVVFLSSYGSSIYQCGNNTGIFRSDDGGFNWTQKNSGLGYCNVYSLGVESNPSGEGEYIYAGKWAAEGYSPGIFRSTNNGDNWTSKFTENIPVYDIEIINSTIYAGLGYNCDPDYHGLLKSTNHGENWTALHNGLEVNASMRIGLVDEDNIWLVGPASVYNSTNGGSSFSEKVSTFKKGNISGLTTNQSGIFCTGDLDAPRISFTTNGGSSWINTVYNCVNLYYNNLLGGKIVTDFDDDNIMHSTHYSSAQILVYKTTDGGSNWYPVYDDLDADPPIAAPYSLKDIAIDPNSHDIVFVCGGGNYKLKVWKSEDRGESYSIVFNDNNNANTLNSIAVDYHVESHNTSLDIYTGGPANNDANMYRSTNSGANWDKYNGGLDGDVNSIAVTPYTSPFVNSYYIFTGTSEGVYRKSNTSDTWSETVSGMDYQNVKTVVADPDNANIIYAGSNDNSSNGHVYVSTDYGDSWTEQNDGFPSASINQLKLCTDPSSGELCLFAATSKGVYQAVESSKDNVNLQKKLNVTSYPNPFNSTTIVSFNVIYDANVEMNVYDILGRKVTTLVKGYFKKGIHSISFQANNLASGIYFLLTRFNNSNILYNKIVLIK